MKITESNLQKMIEIALNTPEVLKDYCYYDGCPTDWNRGVINHRKNGEYLDYHCEECGTKRHYNLDRLRRELIDTSHHGDNALKPSLSHGDVIIKHKGKHLNSSLSSN